MEPLPCPEVGETEIHVASPDEAVHAHSGVVVTATVAVPPVESIEIGADDSET